MITEIHIKTIDELMPLLADQEWEDGIHRNRSSYVYRGMKNANYKMFTSLSRNCKDLQKQLEPGILSNFYKYAVQEDPSLSLSIWHQMISGQHHGLPTRLLDWSHSPLVALHFAVRDNKMEEMDQSDCVVWRIDIPELHSKLPEKYQQMIAESKTKVFTVEMLNEIAPSLSQYDDDMAANHMVVIEPPSTDARIVNQYSFFSVVPMGMTDIEEFLDKTTNNTVKYVIDKDLRWRISDMLDSLNISERIMFPGMDGLSKWIKRHFYVR